MKILLSILVLLMSGANILFAQVEIKPPGKRYKPIILNNDYNHNKFGVKPTDLIYHFAAYTTSFDSDDDNNGDGQSDLWGVPEWVAFEVHHAPDTMPKYRRPSPWLTEDSLYKLRKAPNDKTYAVKGTNTIKVVKTNNRFVRGHMCPKNTADRLGKSAGFNTHTVLNAVPQLQWQNNGVWKSLEKDCGDWANTYNKIWVICGPAYFDRNPAMWLGQAGNVPAAIPDAIFKIVIKENKQGEIETLAFLFPNIINSTAKNAFEFLTSISTIETATGLEFLTNTDLTPTELIAIKEKGIGVDGKDLSKEDKQKSYNKWQLLIQSK